MLIPSFFITEFDTVPDVMDIPLPENTFPAFKIDIRGMDLIRPFYHALFTGNLQNSFCLWVEWDENVYESSRWDDLIDYIISFTFHSLYLTTSYQTPFLIFKAHGIPAADPVVLIREKLRQQGYTSIDYIYIDPNNIISGPATGRKWIYQGIYSDTLLQDPDVSEISLLLSVSSAQQLREQVKQMEQTENELLAGSPYIYSLLYKNMSAAGREKELLFKIGLLTEKIDSQNSYYAFYTAPESEYKKKVTEISDFYNNEYEVLPMWYKRFGHILKVLTGKRSFKSLFNDNVKKYKH